MAGGGEESLTFVRGWGIFSSPAGVEVVAGATPPPATVTGTNTRFRGKEIPRLGAFEVRKTTRSPRRRLGKDFGGLSSCCRGFPSGCRWPEMGFTKLDGEGRRSSGSTCGLDEDESGKLHEALEVVGCSWGGSYAIPIMMNSEGPSLKTIL